MRDAGGPERFELLGASVEFDRDVEHPGWLLAFLVDSRGRRVVSHRFEAISASVDSLETRVLLRAPITPCTSTHTGSRRFSGGRTIRPNAAIIAV